MARIVRTASARRDVVEIWSYIATDNAPAVADGMLARLTSAMEILALTPLMGRKRVDWNGKPRSFAVRKYVIVYEPLPERDGILVWRILHGARNLKRIVRPPRGNDR